MAGAITAEQIDRALDRVAVAIVKAGVDGVGYLPIYGRLETELAAARDRDAMMQRAIERAARVTR